MGESQKFLKMAIFCHFFFLLMGRGNVPCPLGAPTNCKYDTQHHILYTMHEMNKEMRQRQYTPVSYKEWLTIHTSIIQRMVNNKTGVDQ